MNMFFCFFQKSFNIYILGLFKDRDKLIFINYFYNLYSFGMSIRESQISESDCFDFVEF